MIQKWIARWKCFWRGHWWDEERDYWIEGEDNPCSVFEDQYVSRRCRRCSSGDGLYVERKYL